MLHPVGYEEGPTKNDLNEKQKKYVALGTTTERSEVSKEEKRLKDESPALTLKLVTKRPTSLPTSKDESSKLFRQIDLERRASENEFKKKLAMSQAKKILNELRRDFAMKMKTLEAKLIEEDDGKKNGVKREKVLKNKPTETKSIEHGKLRKRDPKKDNFKIRRGTRRVESYRRKPGSVMKLSEAEGSDVDYYTAESESSDGAPNKRKKKIKRLTTLIETLKSSDNEDKSEHEAEAEIMKNLEQLNAYIKGEWSPTKNKPLNHMLSHKGNVEEKKEACRRMEGTSELEKDVSDEKPIQVDFMNKIMIMLNSSEFKNLVQRYGDVPKIEKIAKPNSEQKEFEKTKDDLAMTKSKVAFEEPPADTIDQEWEHAPSTSHHFEGGLKLLSVAEKPGMHGKIPPFKNITDGINEKLNTYEGMSRDKELRFNELVKQKTKFKKLIGFEEKRPLLVKEPCHLTDEDQFHPEDEPLISIKGTKATLSFVTNAKAHLQTSSQSDKRKTKSKKMDSASENEDTERREEEKTASKPHRRNHGKVKVKPWHIDEQTGSKSVKRRHGNEDNDSENKTTLKSIEHQNIKDVPDSIDKPTEKLNKLEKKQEMKEKMMFGGELSSALNTTYKHFLVNTAVKKIVRNETMLKYFWKWCLSLEKKKKVHKDKLAKLQGFKTSHTRIKSFKGEEIRKGSKPKKLKESKANAKYVEKKNLTNTVNSGETTNNATQNLAKTTDKNNEVDITEKMYNQLGTNQSDNTEDKMSEGAGKDVIKVNVVLEEHTEITEIPSEKTDEVANNTAELTQLEAVNNSSVEEAKNTNEHNKNDEVNISNNTGDKNTGELSKEEVNAFKNTADTNQEAGKNAKDEVNATKNTADTIQEAGKNAKDEVNASKNTADTNQDARKNAKDEVNASKNTADTNQKAGKNVSNNTAELNKHAELNKSVNNTRNENNYKVSKYELKDFVRVKKDNEEATDNKNNARIETKNFIELNKQVKAKKTNKKTHKKIKSYVGSTEVVKDFVELNKQISKVKQNSNNNAHSHSKQYFKKLLQECVNLNKESERKSNSAKERPKTEPVESGSGLVMNDLAKYTREIMDTLNILSVKYGDMKQSPAKDQQQIQKDMNQWAQKIDDKGKGNSLPSNKESPFPSQEE